MLLHFNFLSTLFLLTFIKLSTGAALDPATSKECTDTAGKLLTTATACRNEAEDEEDPDQAVYPGENLCSTTLNGRFNYATLDLPGVGRTSNRNLLKEERNKNCETDKIFASRCRRSCKTCCMLPEHGICEDLPGITCQLSQCVDPVNATVLCPATCGKCVELIRSDPDLALCMDTDVDCASKKEQGLCGTQAVDDVCALTCNEPNNNLCKDYTAKMQATLISLAPSAGGVTVPAGGAAAPVSGDKGSNCNENKDLCTNPVYKDFMLDNCAATCRGTSSTGTGTGCTDKPHTNCAIWKRNGFCDNDFYSMETRKENCGQTCKLC